MSGPEDEIVDEIDLTDDDRGVAQAFTELRAGSSMMDNVARVLRDEADAVCRERRSLEGRNLPVSGW